MLFSKTNRLSANFVKMLCLAALLFCVSNTALAQDNDDEDDVPQNVIKLNVGSVFLAHANVAYQRGLSKHFAVQVAGLYGGLDIPIDAKQYIGVDIPIAKSISYQGWGVVPTFRYYPLNVTTAPQGWYAEAFFQYRKALIKNCVDQTIISNPKQYTISLDFTYTGVGIGTGYQFMFGRNKNIVIDAMVGIKYSKVSVRPGWEGNVDFPAIQNPAGGYWISPEDAQTAENYVNRELVNKVNRQEVGLGFLTGLDFLRSALYVGYAF